MTAPALAAGTKICPIIPGARSDQIDLWLGSPVLAPDNSNEEAPSGDDYDLTPHVPGGYYVKCGYVKSAAPDLGVNKIIIEKTFKLLNSYTVCHISEHTRLSCLAASPP